MGNSLLSTQPSLLARDSLKGNHYTRVSRRFQEKRVCAKVNGKVLLMKRAAL